MSAPLTVGKIKPILEARREQLSNEKKLRDIVAETERREKCQRLMQNFNDDMVSGIKSESSNYSRLSEEYYVCIREIQDLGFYAELSDNALLVYEKHPYKQYRKKM